MKKLLFSVLAAVLLLAGCKQQPQVPVQQPHVHEPHEHNFRQWYVNPQKHWQFCEGGEKANEGEHQLRNDGSCAVCTGVVVESDDGSAVVYLYDQAGELYCTAWYDEYGNMIEEEQNNQ